MNHRLRSIACTLREHLDAHGKPVLVCSVHRDGTFFCFACHRGGFWELAQGVYSLRVADTMPAQHLLNEL